MAKRWLLIINERPVRYWRCFHAQDIPDGLPTTYGGHDVRALTKRRVNRLYVLSLRAATVRVRCFVFDELRWDVPHDQMTHRGRIELINAVEENEQAILGRDGEDAKRRAFERWPELSGSVEARRRAAEERKAFLQSFEVKEEGCNRIEGAC